MRVAPVVTELTPLKKHEDKKEEFIEVEIHERSPKGVIQTLFQELCFAVRGIHRSIKEDSIEKWNQQEFNVWKVKNPKFLQLCAQLKTVRKVTFEIFYQKSRALTCDSAEETVSVLALLKKEQALAGKQIEIILPRLQPTFSQKAWGTAIQIGVVAADCLSLWGVSTLSDMYLRFFGYLFGGIGLTIATSASFMAIPSIFNRCCYKGDNLGLQKHIEGHLLLQGLDISFGYREVKAPFCSCEHINTI
jgi:hypothetical protein